MGTEIKDYDLDELEKNISKIKRLRERIEKRESSWKEAFAKGRCIGDVADEIELVFGSAISRESAIKVLLDNTINYLVKTKEILRSMDEDIAREMR